jgi:hypothetical protein
MLACARSFAPAASPPTDALPLDVWHRLGQLLGHLIGYLLLPLPLLVFHTLLDRG